MQTFARARFVRVSPRKARLVADLVRGKTVAEALAILQYSPQVAARHIEKVLRSAVANAEHNHQVRNAEELKVVHAIADGGPSMKRIQPRAMGRAFFIKHRTSHLTIGVSDEVNGTSRPPMRPGRSPRRAAPAPPTVPAAVPASTETGETAGGADKGKARAARGKAPAKKPAAKPREKK